MAPPGDRPEGATLAPTPFPGELARFGWSDRVAALVASADRPDPDPARVLRTLPASFSRAV